MTLLLSLTVALAAAAFAGSQLLFRSQMKRTRSEINRLPTYQKGAPPPHPWLGRHISHLQSRVPLPQEIIGTRAVIVLLSTTCPYCLHRLEEFVSEFLPKHPLPFFTLVQANDRSQLRKFSDPYPWLETATLTGPEFHELELNQIPGFLLVDEQGRVLAVTASAFMLEKEWHRHFSSQQTA